MNPFVELARNPVGTLSAVGYALALLTLLFLTLAATWSNVVWLRVRWDRQRPNQWEYVPPTKWVLRAAAVPGVLAVDAWALAALLWLVAP
jgi:hypothetical protein